MEEIILKKTEQHLVKLSIFNEYISIFTVNCSTIENDSTTMSKFTNIPIRNIGTIEFKTVRNIIKSNTAKILLAITIVLVLLFTLFFYGNNDAGIAITFMSLIAVGIAWIVIAINKEQRKQELIFKNNNEANIITVECCLSSKQYEEIIQKIRTLQ